MDITPKLSQAVRRLVSRKYESQADFARAAGNAIVPQLASVFVQEFLSLPQFSALIPQPFPGVLP